MVIGNGAQNYLFKGSPQYWERARNVVLGSNGLDFLSINLRPICNYRCSNCLSAMGTAKDISRTLSIEETRALISDARDLGVLTIEISGEGEPLIDKVRFEEIIKYANSLGIITTVFSNGSLLNKNILEFMESHNVSLAISMDYFNREDYESDNCRRGSFDNLIRNVALAKEIYSRHNGREGGYDIRRLAVHSIVNAKNINQIPLIAEFCNNEIFYSIAPIANLGNAVVHPELTGIDLQSIQQVIDNYSDGNLILSDSARLNYKQDLCGTFIYGIGVRHDGEVLFDAHAYTTSGIIGNVRNMDLRKLVKRQRNLRELFYHEFSSGGFCPLRDDNYQRFVQHIQSDVNRRDTDE